MTARPSRDVADLAAVEAGLVALPCRLSELAERDYERLHPSHRDADALHRARRRIVLVTAERDEYQGEALDLAIELHHRQGGARGR